MDYSWNQAWHQKSADEKILVTDQHCIDYMMRTLVKSWTDMIAYKEFDDGSTDKYFLVNEWIYPRMIGEDHCELMKELTDNFSSLKSIQMIEDESSTASASFELKPSGSMLPENVVPRAILGDVRAEPGMWKK